MSGTPNIQGYKNHNGAEYFYLKSYITMFHLYQHLCFGIYSAVWSVIQQLNSGIGVDSRKETSEFGGNFFIFLLQMFHEVPDQ